MSGEVASAPCGSCGEPVEASAQLCPLCEEPTGFRARRLRCGVVALVAAASLGLSLGAFVAGVLRGSLEARETRALLAKQRVSAPQIEAAREVELLEQRRLQAEIAQLRSLVAAQASTEAGQLLAELEELPTRDEIYRVRSVRREQLQEAFGE